MADEEDSVTALRRKLEEDIKNTPFYKSWYYVAKRRWDDITDIPYRIQCFWQRGRRGYSYRDLWSFDYYLSDVISKGLRDLAKTTHGYPDQAVGSFENWQRLLFIIATAFEEHNTDEDVYADEWEKFGSDEAIKRLKERYEIRKEKMKLIIDYWGNLWD
jgi:hypothetical protein